MTATVSHLDDRAAAAPAPERYTIDSLARVVGMSPRNIRAHQARGLLAPPTRHGRTAYYAAGHVRRLESIKLLQRQGFNLVAIEAMLGVRRSATPPTEPLTAALSRLATERPATVRTLTRHGVLAHGPDGVVTVTRARAVQPALDLQRAGVPVPAGLTLLSEVLDELRLVAEELVRDAGSRMLAMRRPGSVATARGQLDHEATALTQSLTHLLSEAFRVVAENSGEAAMSDFVAGPPPVDRGVEERDGSGAAGRTRTDAISPASPDLGPAG
ncbi:MerR family transcriptional regulator [Plantactinospora sp. S1510]|uniref:MerR family transcriptional regulator n=1 Tax=Plantactinospora alkalitolerans TaxID=2789879 RepID=A0ABS0GQ70_9ACTN|nr:MerR family transcriptional regulator [Plantactinospora alkalitolerans]MBF9128336.1 MerR family transcriptional regulator [Plantactinospora alkalitolerans]